MYPFIRLSENHLIPSYMLVISLAYCVALGFAYFRARRLDLDSHIAMDIALCIMVGGFIGARAFHVFYEYPEVYRAQPGEILKFWQGGFVYYGGLIGGFLISMAYMRVRRISFWEWADFYAPVIALGYALGRIACFLNGCCYGALCKLPWAVEFTHIGLPPGLRHPTPLYATLLELCVFAFLLWIEKNRRLKAGGLFGLWLVLHGVNRVYIETYRDDFRGDFIAGFSISTWISIVIMTIGFVIFSRRLPPQNEP